MELSGRTVVVVGLGRSGVAAARLCRAQGAAVVGVDAAKAEELTGDARALAHEGVRLVPSSDGRAELEGADFVVVSPGVPPGQALAEVERRGVEVVSELELASRYLDAPIVLVGGTNGKSTVTALVGAILQAAGQRAFIGGNFGTPLCEAIGGRWDALVVEISSFQAERVPTLHPQVVALLNVSEDHLDRYESFAHYAAAKGNPFVRTTAEDVAVIPAGDSVCAAQAARGQARQVTFSAAGEIGDVVVVDEVIVDRLGDARYPLAELQLEGQHNAANACAAVACAAALDVRGPAVSQALSEFRGLDHRTELVGRHRGVRYLNDSKGTNVGATVAALRGLREPRAVLIAGGKDKQGAYAPLVDALRERGRALVVLGEAAERIASAASGALPIVRVKTMPEAVGAATELARPGDAVLLSPACSSYDMFRNYQERGEAFAAAVRAVLEEES